MKSIFIAACLAMMTAACVDDTSDSTEDNATTNEITQDLVGSGRCNSGYWNHSADIINGWQHNGGSICCDGATIQTIHRCETCYGAPWAGPTWCHLY
jgi:hypothetical protein